MSAQLRMDSWTAIDLPVFVKDAMDLSGEFAIFSLMGARLALAPFIIPTHAHSQCAAQRRDRILLAVLGKEHITQDYWRQKMAKAVFKLSRSCRVTSSSRFNRRSSSSCGV